MSFAYSATTDLCTFLLDEDGVCRRVLLKNERRGDSTLGGRTRAQAARRCIGAQYVASIDLRVDGGLVPMPRVGAPMLFAYTGDDGRLAVVRTGPLVRFETLGSEPESTAEIHVEWDGGEGLGQANDDDEPMTIPLRQSGERPTPRLSLFDTLPIPIPDPDPDVTPRDPWVPPVRRSATESWASLPHPPAGAVRLQNVRMVGRSMESAPTLKDAVSGPPGRGMLPRRSGRA